MATDETYRDLTNLEGKLQMHQKFEAELIPNEQRIQAIAQVGALCGSVQPILTLAFSVTMG